MPWRLQIPHPRPRGESHDARFQFSLILTAALLSPAPAGALELIGVFDGNDFFSEGNDRCTVCDIVGDQNAFLLAKLEDEASADSTLFELTFDDDKNGTWTQISGSEEPTHMAVKAGPMFALYEIRIPTMRPGPQRHCATPVGSSRPFLT